MEIWFWIDNGQILSNFDRVIYSPQVYIFISINRLSKYLWVFTKLGMCIDIMKICTGKFYQFLTELSFRSTSVLGDNLSKCQWFFTKLCMCIYIVILFEITNGLILSVFDRVFCLPHDSSQILSFLIFYFLAQAEEERLEQIQRQRTYKMYKKTHVLTALVSL